LTKVTCGIDWTEDHHDVALVDGDGIQLVRQRISDDTAGFATLLAVLAEHGDNADQPIPVAIETSHGLLVAALRATRRPIYPINPLAVARYRDRHSVAGKKSDPGDALTLANIPRTDAGAHRTLPADSELTHAIAVLARAQQDAVWDRIQAQNKLRSLLREYYPAMLRAFDPIRDGLASPVARTILAAAPTPAKTAKLTTTQLRGLLKRADRQRGLDAEADRLHAIFRGSYLHQPPMVEDALGHQALALLRQLDAACQNAEDLATTATEHFKRHPDADIITSFPGLGLLTGARVLAEIGDDRSRFQDARGLKSYAGAAPVTRASGKRLAVHTRRVKNQHLAAVGYIWAFSSLRASPGARAHYDRRKQAGDRHTAAQRNLFNRILGMLHHCLHTHQTYHEQKAFPVPQTKIDNAAA
jgi:transposase